ncbi:hypothetical protein BTH42_14850 [Burkholderia sp. SRS-W-2-2016]|uniref:LysM peptidoglycan-binding domain-containing protein n=1 Tax=Burkholderia sp. SRS-W-2-2016 TaxID=1926878 RepID=UPI00094B3213|nr:LysM peptidoglycan-binding domain-containing protein [Burkholderia sp. SRS-W-2-2016]OLL30852.1 hypothetical protein BTH42_14850 [Burkholderia sp. SRS-W-2-2016]
MVAIVTGNGLGLQSSSALGLGARGQVGNASFGQTGEQIYVNAANGNLVIQDLDQLLLGQGVNSAIHRAYNSLGQFAGDNWRPGGSRTVDGLTGTLNTAGSTITRTDWDGTAITYAYDGTRNLYVATSGTGARATLAFDAASNTWNWSDGANQLTEAYDANHGGRLGTATDRDGNTVNYAYNAAGLLAQVTTASGEATYLHYNAAQQLTDLRTVYLDASGRQATSTTVRYAYDTAGRLSQAIVDLSPEDSSIVDGSVFTTSYTYDGASSRVASIAQSDGSRVSFTYGNIGGEYRVTSISQTSDAGVVRITTLTYDTAKNETTATDPLGFTTVLTYDGAGRLTSIASAVANGTTRYQAFYYDADGNVARMTDSGSDTRYRYDSRGNLVWIQDFDGKTVERSYGENNELLTETVYLVATTGVPELSDPAVTRYVYDSNNHLRFVVSPEGRVTEYRYNAAGQQTSVLILNSAYAEADLSEAALANWVAGLTSLGDSTRIDTTYDFRGNVDTVTRYGKLLADGTGNIAWPGEITCTRYVYDASGRLLQRYVGAPGQQQVEQFTYDGLGRLLSATQFNGVLTLYAYDNASHTVCVTLSNGLTRTMTYSAAGELLAVVESARGAVLSQVLNYFDVNGRLRMTVDANGERTHYLYNRAGMRVAEIGPDGTLTEYTYTPAGLLTCTTRYANTVSPAALASLVDANGQPVQTVTVSGKPAELTLDSAGLRPSASSADRTEWRAYDSAGRVSRTVDAEGLFTLYQYNGAGRLVGVTQYANRANPATEPNPATATGPATSPDDRTTRYFYDHDGLLCGQLDAQGYLTEYRYNAAGEKVEEIRYANAIVEYGRVAGTLVQLVPAKSAADIHQYYLYDARGLLRAEIDGEGFVTTYSYDARGNVAQRVRGQQVDPGLLRAPQQIPVTISATGKPGSSGTVEVWIDGVRAGALAFDFSSGTSATSTLAVPNLVSLANHTIELRYPADSGLSIWTATFGPSWLSKADELRTSTDGSPSQQSLRYVLRAHEALSWADRPGTMEFAYYTYDEMGRLTNRTTSQQDGMGGRVSTDWTWDDEGHLTSETTAGRTTTYRYDLQGRLVAQLDGEGSDALAALGTSATQAQIDIVWQTWGVNYTYDAAGLRTSMTDANGNTTFYYYDVAERLTHIVNPMGEVVEYQYDTFGDVTQTVVYATRVAEATLASLAGGLLPDALRNTFTALCDEGEATRTTFSYSAAGRLLQRADALGLNTRYTYNTFGEQISTVRDIAPNVQVRDTTDYDRLGQVIRQTTDPGGLNLITQAVYDAFGRLIESIDANGVVRRQNFDRNGNVVVLTDGTGARTQLTYDAFGNVLTRTDANGNETTWSYSEFDRSITVTSPDGIQTTSSYDEHGQIVALTDGRGKTTRYAYDHDGNLLGTTDATGATTTSSYDRAGHVTDTVDARGIHTTYTYDAAGRVLTRSVDPTGLNLVTRYEYDAKGQATRVTDPSGVVTETRFDLAGRAVAVTTDVGGLNLLTTFTYDGLGNVVSVTEGAGSSNPRITQNVYDKAGRLISTIADPDRLGLKTGYAYDGNGNVVSATDASGAITRYVYDEEGRQIWSAGPTGAVVRNVYDAAGRLVSRTAFASNLSEVPATLSDAYITDRLTLQPSRDQTTRYVYDADDRVRYVVNALNNVTENVYDANGNVIRTIAYATPVTISGPLTADAVGAALTAQSPQVHASDRVTRMIYDAANRLTATIDALGFVTYNLYDASGVLLERTQYQTPYPDADDPEASALQSWLSSPGVAIASGDRTTTWIYDAAARPAYVVDAEGYVTENRYDEAGRLTETIRYADVYSEVRGANQAQAAALLPQTIPATAAATQYGYDSAGRLTSVTNAAGVVTRYELDALGRAVNTSVADGLPEQSVTHAVFDAAGRLIEQTRAYGSPVAVTTRYTYDAMGRVTAEIDPRGVELAEQDTAWALAERKARGYVDANNEALAAAALSQTQKSSLLAAYRTTYRYDARGNLRQTIDPLGYITENFYDGFGNRTAARDKNGNQTNFLYDALNRVEQVISPTQSRVVTKFDAFGQAIRVTQDGNAVTQMEYDGLGRLVKSIDAEGYSELYGYDAFGNRISYTNKVGGQFAYTYDRRGLLLSETLPVTSGGNAVVNAFEYDARGNRITTIEAQGLGEECVTRYSYDLLDRQLNVAKQVYLAGYNETVTEAFAYDARGNLVSHTAENGSVTRWYYDAADRKTAQITPLGTLTLWTNDAAGNVISTRIYADPVVAKAGQPAPPPEPVDATRVRETRYVYDADNRLTQSRVQNVATGYFDPNAGDDQRGEYFITSGSELVTTWEYDGNGQVIATTDAAGNRTMYFYNRSGQKTLEVDAKGFGIAYTVNAQGYVTEEIRFAQALQDPITTSSDPAALISQWPRNADDRITNYTWDNNGRLLSESRMDVQFAVVDSNGKLVQSTGNATTTYVYDGEGHLVRKIDANGSQYDFTYDALGHLTAQILPQFADNQGRQVRATTVYEYDGLGNVVKETRKGDVDQVTVYLYGAGGRLKSKMNSLKVWTNFFYDQVGNNTQVGYGFKNADGEDFSRHTFIRYDAEGREVLRFTDVHRSDFSLQNEGVKQEIRYNAYGEVTGRRTGGGGASGEWQEYADYNNAGWVVRTNFDDGVSHLFMYDRNGNATLKVESMENDLRYREIATGDDLKALLQSVDMMQTYTRYDARNQVIQIRQPKTSGGIPTISFSPVDIPIDGGVFANTQLSIAGWLDSSARPVTGPTRIPIDGDVGIIGTDARVNVTGDWSINYDSPPSGMGNGLGGLVTVNSLTFALPDFSEVYGAYNVEVRLTYTGSGSKWYYRGGATGGNDIFMSPFTYSLSASSGSMPMGTTSVTLPINWMSGGLLQWGNAGGTSVTFEYAAEVYVTPLSSMTGPVLVGTITQSSELFSSSSYTGDASYSKGKAGDSNALDSSSELQVASGVLTVARNSLPDGAQGMLYYRPKDADSNFQLLPQGADSQPNSYSVNISNLPDGDYEIIFIAVSGGEDGDIPSTLLRRDSYEVHLDRVTGSSVKQTELPYYDESSRPGFLVDSSGTYIWSAPQVLNIYALQSTKLDLVDHIAVHLRDPNNPNWQLDYPVWRDPATGAFQIDLASLGGGVYEISLDLFDSTGAQIDALRGTVNLPGNGQSPSFALDYLVDLKSTVVFHAQPAGTDHMVVSWERDGIAQYATLYGMGGDFLWDTTNTGLQPDTDYAIKFTAYDTAGRPLSMGQGDIRIGVNTTSEVTLTGSALPSIFEFSPTDSNGARLDNVETITLYYRESTKQDGDYDRPFSVATLTRDADGRFLFDAGDLPTNVEYEYRYLANDAAGNVLMERQSYFLTGTRNNPVTNVDIVGVIEELAKDMTIDRLQQYNAFGDVSAERDGRGNWTYSSYNTMGYLTLKREPTVMVTLENGAQVEMAPLTSYYYDLTGNLVGLKDANGHLSTQQWNYGLAQPAVAQSWDAMGYSKRFSYDALGNLRVSVDELSRRTDYTYDNANRLIEIARPALANGQRSIDRYEYDSSGNRIAHTDALGGRERIYYDADGHVVKTISATGSTVQYDYRWASTISSIGSVVSGGWVKTTIDANGRSMVDEVDLFGRVTKHTDLGGHVFEYTYNWAGLLTKQEGSTGQLVEYTYYSHGLVRSIVDFGTQTQSLYEYDGDGNRTAEFFTNFGDSYVFAQSRVEYDALNRVVAIRDNSYQVYYEYDAVGNRRRMLASYTDMVGYHATEQEYWYEYDALNRFTVSMGSLSGARATDPNDTSVHIVAGAAGGDGVQLGYNAAGERTMAVYATDGRTESYTYDANGFLATQSVDGVVIQQRTNDLLGRVTETIERDRSSGQIVTAVTRGWDADSQLMSEHDNLNGSTTTYTRMADGTLEQVVTRPDSGSGTTMTTTYSYEWWDSAKQSQILAQGSNPDAPGWKPASSYFNYDVNGNLKAAYDDGGGQAGDARAFTYYTDLRGQVQRRDELVGVTVSADGTIRGATGDRKHNYYYLNGNRVGNQGNDGVESVDYVQELAGKLAKGSESQYKVFTPVSSADFDENFMAINGVYPGVSPGTWTVRDGDTLQSIASSLWGDATLWYILADANRLKGDDVLKAGQMLTVPNKVTNVHNTATTFKPYDPGKAIGDTQPTLPDPPPPPGKGGGCGPVAAIIAVVVAAVATVFTAGAASMALAGTLSSFTVSGAMTAGAAALTGGGAAMGFGTAVAASVIGGAVGTAAAQGVMIAAGEQSGFSWKGVAMGAVGAAVGSSVLGATGVGTAVGSAFSGSGASQFAGAATQGAMRSVATQGIGMLTGAQHGFDWKGVAASAIASGVAYGATQAIGQWQYGDAWSGMSSDALRADTFNSAVRSIGADLAAGTASTIVRGGSLGRNVGAITMDAIASTVGNMVVDRVANASTSTLYGPAGNVDAMVAGATVYQPTSPNVFSMPAESYSANTALFGYGMGTLDTVVGSAATDAYRTSKSPQPYSASSTLFGPSMGLQDQQRPIMLADAGGNPENTLLAWEHAAKQATSDSVNFVKGLANTPIQFVNGGLDLGHAAVAGLETVGVFPPGAAAGKTPQIPYFQTDGGFAARSGNAAGFALSMIEQIPEQFAIKGAQLLDTILPGQVVKSTSTLGAVAGATYRDIVGQIPGRILFEADAMTPGALGGDIAGTFSGGRYATMQLDQPLTVYRAWAPGQSREFGAFWSLEQPSGSLQTRIDSALLPEWGNIRGTSFSTQASQYTTMQLPAGTNLHIGEVGSQGSAWVGGKSQLLIDGGAQPLWKIGGGVLR